MPLTTTDFLLQGVQKPARYTGGELGAVVKDLAGVALRACFCFPDTYEIGMSHLGLQILYGVANAIPDVWCERAFAPWNDMEELLREYGAKLPSLESGTPLSGFGVLAFTLQYELCYTNVLNMLELGGVPLPREARGERDPVVIAGGPCAFNPEPMADFIDAFAVGDGEDSFPEMLNIIKLKLPRRETLERLSRVEGVYVPAFPRPTVKRIVKDLDAAYYPAKPLVPNTEVVHDRVMAELFRGCIRGCRFCQAGFATRPVRERRAETLAEQGIKALNWSGCEEIALTSLSSSDYPGLEDLADKLLEYCEPKRISLSLPSLRADSFSRELLQKVQKVRKSGLTFAPEAGTARLRDVINKNLSEEALLNACSLAFEGGWNNIKLYFMLGLPTETDDDILGIAALAEKVYFTWRQKTPDRSRGVRITVSVSCFVPKPLTPFQWCAQDSVEEFRRKQSLLKKALRKQMNYQWHDPETSVLEGAFARGDRRLGAVILSAHKAGCRMDAWKEHFNFAAWEKAFAEHDMPLSGPEFDTKKPLPWDYISAGVTDAFLKREYNRAINGEPTPDCRSECSDCGASALTGGACNA
ncbi:radical SAM domain protein [Clostridia bacterium]|nr:radical SAM domain protein [Clostridia bacterium]